MLSAWRNCLMTETWFYRPIPQWLISSFYHQRNWSRLTRKDKKRTRMGHASTQSGISSSLIACPKNIPDSHKWVAEPKIWLQPDLLLLLPARFLWAGCPCSSSGKATRLLFFPSGTTLKHISFLYKNWAEKNTAVDKTLLKALKNKHN